MFACLDRSYAFFDGIKYYRVLYHYAIRTAATENTINNI